MKSTKYRKYQASRHKNKTKLVNDVLVIGHVEAKKEVENRIGRKLHPDTKVKKTLGQWVFCEPLS